MLQCVNDRELIAVSKKVTAMPAYVDLSSFWIDPKNPRISEAIDKTGLDRRTLSAARKGHLDRCQIETLLKLRDFASELAGRTVSLDEICKEEKQI